MHPLPPALSALREACAVMSAKEVLAIAPRGWSLPDMAEIAGVEELAILTELRKQFWRLPPPQRIEAVCAYLSANGLTPPGAWTVGALSKMANCDRATMHRRLTMILTYMRHRIESKPRTLTV